MYNTIYYYYYYYYYIILGVYYNMFSAARWPTIEFADVVGSSIAYIYIHVYNKAAAAAAACVVGFVSKNERMDEGKKMLFSKRCRCNKNCCNKLLICTVFITCTVLQYSAGGVNFGHVFSVSLTHTHTPTHLYNNM
jgi:hypothetical protein